MTNPDSTQDEAFEPSIGICTALPKELAACRLILDSPFPVNSDSVEDGNQYYLGSIPSRAGGKPHQVLVTSLAKMGNNVATGAVTQMTRSFPSVDFILMVGIAGGIPDPQNQRDHVRLGDVVVSNEKGVLQYDQIKKTPDSIEIRDSSTKPSAALIAAAKALESDIDLGLFSLEPHLRRAEHLAHFQHPAPETDVLHASEDQETRIPHPDDPWREEHPTSPRVHLGVIGSANTLQKDPLSRDRLREKYGILAIEMEGSGTADAAWSSGKQYLVIRGICDYCDTHKNNDWQYYAALVAAAYARVLIENLPYRPPRRYDAGSSTRQEIQPKIDGSGAARSEEALDIDLLRSELGDVFASMLESIIEKRMREGPDAAWDALNIQLATMPRDGISNQIQARFFYHAARWSQEDGRPAPQAKLYHKKVQSLVPTFDDRTYCAFEAVSKGSTDDAIDILRPFDTESSIVNLCRHLLEAGRAQEAETLLDQFDTPLTGEVRRMRSLCLLAAGDPESAWRMLEPAMPERVENPLFLLTAGYIAYWQAMPSDFRIPGALGPSVYQAGLLSLDDDKARRMAEAIDFLKTAFSLLPSSSNSPLKQDARDACIAACMVLTDRHSYTIEIAQSALRDDPVAHLPAICLLRLGVEHDWSSTIAALTAVCDLPHPQVAQLDLVIELLIKTGKPESAWKYLERSEHRYLSGALTARWFELAIRCLAPLDRLPELEQRVDGLDECTEHRRLKAAFWSACGDSDKTLVIAEDLAKEPGDRLDLTNLVAVHSSKKMWIELVFSARCCLRRYPDVSAQVADALVHGFLELDDPAAALATLQTFEAAYQRDGMLDDYYSRRMSATGALGQYQDAFDASERLWNRRPNERLLEHRAHLQILLGDVPHALDMLKQGVARGFETPQILINIAHYSLIQDREEAFSWAKRAVERFPDDPQVRANSMHIGFNAGHGDWATMQMGMLTQGFPDSGLYQQVDPPEMLKWMQARQAQSATNWRSFAEGTLSFHRWVDAESQTLGAEFYWRWHFNKERLPGERVPLPMCFGGRPASTWLSEWTGRSLVMDYTACLSAHLLKLFPVLEKALDEILVSPSLFAVIEAEMLRLSQTQPDRVVQAEQLLARLESDSITLLMSPKVTQGDFSGLLPTDRLKWILAEHHGLSIVEDRFATEMLDGGEIPPALDALRVYEISVIDALRVTGELILDDDQIEQLSARSPIAQATSLPGRGAGLLVDRPFFELLLEVNGLDAAMSYFRLFAIDDLPEQLRSEIESYRYRQKIKAWLGGLLATLKGLREKGKLNTLTVRPPVIEGRGEQHLTHELGELLSGSEKLGHPVWIDDRMLSSYQRNGRQTPIIGVHDILGTLHSRRAMTDGKFCECHRELIRCGSVFRSPPPEYLGYELAKAAFDETAGSIKENLPLSRLRQSVDFMLAPGGLLGESPVREGLMPERAQFKMQLNICLDVAMAAVWNLGGEEFAHRSAMADWLHNAFLPHPGRPIADTSFKDDLLQGMAFEHSLRISLGWRLGNNPRSVRAYYSWLFHRLMPAWRNHPELPGAVMSHFTDLVTTLLKNLSNRDHSEELIARFVQPLIHLPPEVFDALLSNPELKPTLKRHVTLGAHIGNLDLFVPGEIFSDFASKSIENMSGNPIVGTVKGREVEVKFAPGSGVNDCIIVAGDSANGLHREERILTPYIRLEHPNPRIRLEWIDDLTGVGILGRDAVLPWRDALETDDFAAAADAVHIACERSANFFFANAGAILNIPDPSEHDWQEVLPTNCEILEAAASRVSEEEFDTNRHTCFHEGNAAEQQLVARLVALPFGPPFDLASVASRSLASGKISSQKLRNVSEALAATSFNPVVLQNLLSLFLHVPDLSDEGQAQKIAETLLALDLDPKFSLAFEIYVDLLHIIWSHFRLTPEFQGKRYEQRVIWAYIYADRLLRSLLGEESPSIGLLQTAVNTTRKIRDDLAQRLSPLLFTEEIESDVTIPSSASRWRTIICGTLGVLRKDTTALNSIQAEVVSLLESLLDSLHKPEEKLSYGFEFLELSDYPQGEKNSYISNRGWATALELLASLKKQEKPVDRQPEVFWAEVLEHSNVEALASYLAVLAAYPIPADLEDRAAATVGRIIDGFKFNRETCVLYRSAASLLGRNKSEALVGMRERMFEKAFVGVSEEHSLWLEACELSLQVDRFKKQKVRIERLISVLKKTSLLLDVDKSEYGEYVAWVRNIEAHLPSSSWKDLWQVFETTKTARTFSN